LAGNTIGIVDYVLARRLEENSPEKSDYATRAEIPLGTPTFFAPEEVLGKEIDQRSDLYSLAATMYYLLTGSLPLDFITRSEALARGQLDPQLRIDQSNPLAQSNFARVLIRALAFNATERPASAKEMVAELVEVGREMQAFPLPDSTEKSALTTTPSASPIAAGSDRRRPSPRVEYEVFISYRRQNGSSEARLIRAELMHQQGVSAFLDVVDLGAGHFDEALLKRIAEIPNFVVILSAGCLDRCRDARDWLRREIVQALRTNRKIIPVLLPGFNFPDSEELPHDLRSLSSHQSVFYNHEYFDAMIAKIVRYFRQA
jgi:serine/threonine protein kinase